MRVWTTKAITSAIGRVSLLGALSLVISTMPASWHTSDQQQSCTPLQPRSPRGNTLPDPSLLQYHNSPHYPSCITTHLFRNCQGTIGGQRIHRITTTLCTFQPYQSAKGFVPIHLMFTIYTQNKYKKWITLRVTSLWACRTPEVPRGLFMLGAPSRL